MYKKETDKGIAQQMREAERRGDPIPELLSVHQEGDDITEKLDMIIKGMTKYNPKERISFDQVHEKLKALTG